MRWLLTSCCYTTRESPSGVVYLHEPGVRMFIADYCNILPVSTALARDYDGDDASDERKGAGTSGSREGVNGDRRKGLDAVGLVRW